MEDRVFIDDLGSGELVEIRGDELHHLTRVRRKVAGDLVIVFDGRRAAQRARLVEVGKARAVARLEGEPLPGRESVVELTLATAVPKGDRFDWLVEKAVELGVARLIPLRTERSVVDPRSSKLDRLRRAVIEASKQCGRDRLMEVAEPATWRGLLARSNSGARWFAHPGGDWLDERAQGAESPVVIAIGPEGGLTDEECRAAEEAGWTGVGLGPTILRVETAALAACALILLRNRGGESCRMGR